MRRVEIITGWERRRSPSIEEKLRILSEGRVHGVSLASVARRHDFYPQQLYKWRKELTEAGFLGERATEQPTFFPVELTAAPPSRRRGRPPARLRLVEIALTNGQTLRAAPDIDPEMLRGLVRSLEEA